MADESDYPRLRAFALRPSPAKLPPSRILLIADYPPPAGGVAVHAAGLAQAIREAGGTVVVLDIGKGQLPAADVLPAGGYAQFGATVARHVRAGFRLHLHTSGANWKSWALAEFVAAAPHGPAPVVTLHSGLLPAWLTGRVRRSIARLACSGFGAVLCVSEQLASAIVRCGVEPRSVHVVTPFVGFVGAPGAVPPAVAPFVANHALVITAALGPGAEYAAPLLVEAVRKLRAEGVDAALVAYGSGSHSRAIQSIALSIGNAALLLGAVDRPTAIAVMKSAQIFVRPTLADGDALSVREALSLGRTVVASDAVSRPPGVILFKSGDATALASALLVAHVTPVVAQMQPDGAAEVLQIYRECA